MRFELIDQVIQQDATSLTAVKNVSAAEEYLQDHFPGFPVLPGVMMLEALAQAARRLVAGLQDTPRRPLIIQQVRNVKYAQMVRPGQTLTVEVQLRGREDDAFAFQGAGRVGDDLAVQGRFTLSPA